MTTIATTSKRNDPPARQTGHRSAAPIEPSPDLIRRRAYEIFLARNGRPGDHVADWCQAERELKGMADGVAMAARPRERGGTSARSAAGSPRVRDCLIDGRA